MSRALAPVLVMVSVLDVLVLPTRILPKLRVFGLNVIGVLLVPEPVPVSITTCGLFAALSAINTAPFTAPSCVGVNVTFSLQDALLPKLLPHGVLDPGATL